MLRGLLEVPAETIAAHERNYNLRRRLRKYESTIEQSFNGSRQIPIVRGHSRVVSASQEFMNLCDFQSAFTCGSHTFHAAHPRNSPTRRRSVNRSLSDQNCFTVRLASIRSTNSQNMSSIESLNVFGSHRSKKRAN